MPSNSSFDTISFHPLQRPERRHADDARECALDRTVVGIVVAQHEGDHLGSSRRAINSSMWSSSKALKNPRGSSTDEGDRRRLPQLRLPVTIADSRRSVGWPTWPIDVVPEFSTAAAEYPHHRRLTEVLPLYQSTRHETVAACTIAIVDSGHLR